MIQNLALSSLSFKGNENVSPREAYDSQMTKNSQMAQKQNGVVANMAAQINHQVPMQGVGQKLDVIA
ncbi:hypothetical protein IJ425_06690 [bacterium]|nr:hypothetical protein [bacterium]